MSLNWNNAPDGTRMATGHESVYVLRDFGPAGSGGRDAQLECRMTGDKYPRVILRGTEVTLLLVEAGHIENSGMLLTLPAPSGGYYMPAETPADSA